MNTKIQVLNSIDLENIFGGGDSGNFLNGLTTPFGYCMNNSGISDSDVLKEFKNKGCIKGLRYLYSNGFYVQMLGDFSGIFNGGISERAGSLTAFVGVVFSLVGAYKGIKWAIKKVF